MILYMYCPSWMRWWDLNVYHGNMTYMAAVCMTYMVYICYIFLLSVCCAPHRLPVMHLSDICN